MKNLETINYSEKAIVIYGNTKEYKEQLKQLGGRFNPYLTINGTKQAGWVFSKQKTELINNFIASLNGQTFNEVCTPCKYELPTKVQTETPIVTPVIASSEPIVTPEPEPIIQEQKQVETPKIKQVIKQAVSKFKANFKSIFAQFKNNNALPILDNVKVENNGTACLSDLETNVILPNYFSNKSEGTICLPLEQIKNIKDANLLRLDIQQTELKATLGMFKLTGCEVDLFPINCDKVFKHIGTLDKNGIDITKIAVDYTGKDELRPYQTGVYFDKTNGNIVSTDAHKLYYKQAHNLTESFIINKKTAKLLSLLSDTYEVYLSDDFANVKFESTNGTIISRTIDAKFANYEAVLPKNNSKIFSMDKAKLVKTINEAIKCANKTTKKVLFSFAKDIAVLSSEELDFGLEYSCEIQAESNEVFDIGFNGKFLLDILANVSDNKITIKAEANNRAVLINDDFLLMPVMI